MERNATVPVVGRNGYLGDQNGCHLSYISNRTRGETTVDLPGKRRESLIRSINAKRGKWFKQASIVSKVAFKDMIAILAEAKVK